MSAAPEKWNPLTGMPAGAEAWGNPAYAAMDDEWCELQDKLTDRTRSRAFVDGWLLERKRAFAIENGQIENLYTLRRGITERFITEGFEGARAAHTVEGVPDQTLRGMLEDQQAALEMVFVDVAGGRPLGAYEIRSWHQLMTRHQETVPAITPFGQRVEVPFERKGQWKNRSNNPRRPDGVIHEYCPPELVPEEMERFFDLYQDIRERDYPVEVEAAWLHHRFVRAHPFQDGNGRISRLLMAYPYLKRGLPPTRGANRGQAAVHRHAGGGGHRGSARVRRVHRRTSYRRPARLPVHRPQGSARRSRTPERQRRSHGRRAVLPAEREGTRARARLTGWSREGPTPNWPRRPRQPETCPHWPPWERWFQRAAGASLGTISHRLGRHPIGKPASQATPQGTPSPGHPSPAPHDPCSGDISTVRGRFGIIGAHSIERPTCLPGGEYDESDKFVWNHRRYSWI